MLSDTKAAPVQTIAFWLLSIIPERLALHLGHEREHSEKLWLLGTANFLKTQRFAAIFGQRRAKTSARA